LAKACAQCGVCCLFEVCPVGMDFFGIDKFANCPALYFDEGDKAVCLLVFDNESMKGTIGVGVGCDIRARAYKDGKQYDFSLLPDNLKMRVSKQMRRKVKWTV
jgi:hypothetical protein